MEKIGNIYCWNYLNDWMEAQRTGMVHIVEVRQCGTSIFPWEQLVHMLYEDCFPESFLCFRKRNENYLIVTNEQREIFNFIEGKRILQEKEGVQYRFPDCPAEFRSRILNAQVDSIWIKLYENDRIGVKEF